MFPRERFLLSLSAERRAAVDTPELDLMLARIWEECVQRWSNGAVSSDQFFPYLAARTGEIPLRSLHVTDLYLACGCALKDEAALEAFERLFGADIDATLARVTRDDEIRSAVRANVAAHLFVPDPGKEPRITTYTGQGSLLGFVRVVVTRLALGMGRKARPTEVEPVCDNWRDPAEDPELAFLKSTYKKEFQQAFALALAELPDRERTVLRFQLVDGWSIDQVAALYQVHRSTAARWAERGRELLGTGTHRHLMERLNVGREEAESILRLIRSQLDVSAERLLREGS